MSDRAPPNPSGLCQCGCGRRTKVAARKIKHCGVEKGEHMRFLRGHQLRAAARERSLRFSARQLAEMERMYRQGDSTHSIAEHFGCLSGSVWARLRERGVEMRPRSFSKRSAVVDSGGYARWGDTRIHRIVAEAWYGPIPEGHHVHHKGRRQAEQPPR